MKKHLLIIFASIIAISSCTKSELNSTTTDESIIGMLEQDTKLYASLGDNKDFNTYWGESENLSIYSYTEKRTRDYLGTRDSQDKTIMNFRPVSGQDFQPDSDLLAVFGMTRSGNTFSISNSISVTKLPSACAASHMPMFGRQQEIKGKNCFVFENACAAIYISATKTNQTYTITADKNICGEVTISESTKTDYTAVVSQTGENKTVTITLTGGAQDCVVPIPAGQYTKIEISDGTTTITKKGDLNRNQYYPVVFTE